MSPIILHCIKAHNFQKNVTLYIMIIILLMKQNLFKIFDLSLMNFHGLKYKMFNLIFIGSIIENVCLSVCILSILAFILLNFS